MTATTTTESAPIIKNQYIVPVPSIRYIFKSGKTAAFVGYKYFTDDPAEIAELDAEVAAGHPDISVDPKNLTIDMATLDPINKIRAEVREEIRAEMLRDMGITNQGEDMAAKLQGIVSSANLAKGSAADSSS